MESVAWAQDEQCECSVAFLVELPGLSLPFEASLWASVSEE